MLRKILTALFTIAVVSLAGLSAPASAAPSPDYAPEWTFDTPNSESSAAAAVPQACRGQILPLTKESTPTRMHGGAQQTYVRPDDQWIKACLQYLYKGGGIVNEWISVNCGEKGAVTQTITQIVNSTCTTSTSTMWRTIAWGKVRNVLGSSYPAISTGRNFACKP